MKAKALIPMPELLASIALQCLEISTLSATALGTAVRALA
jgi:hypothetical protein